MTAQAAPSNHPVFLLAEHLDMLLAAIEDLEASRPPQVPVDPQQPGSLPRVSLREFARDLAHYESMAIVRLGRARELTRKLVREDQRFAMLGGLFVSGTAPLDDAVERMLDTTGAAFATGGDPIAYLRSRGLVEVEVDPTSIGDNFAIGERFRIAGEIEIAPLVELVTTFLNTIELHFDLFPELTDHNDEVDAFERAKALRPGEMVS